MKISAPKTSCIGRRRRSRGRCSSLRRGCGHRVNIAVVDAGGNLAAFLRMPGAFLHSIDIAIDKAYTAAGFGLPTAAWTKALASAFTRSARRHSKMRPRMVCFGGGLPLRHEGKLIGGIGVSGGSSEDEACARAERRHRPDRLTGKGRPATPFLSRLKMKDTSRTSSTVNTSPTPAARPEAQPGRQFADRHGTPGSRQT